ncbi:MAG: 3-hydroxyacyl-CoA dehydrogenase NAD-binding domain-containing protein [Edaphocola sp.]
MNLTIGIVGAGAMGTGIAQVMATAGHKVILTDTLDASLNKAKTSLATALDKLVAKGKITDDERKNIIANHQYTTALNYLEACDLVIEAIVENKNIKADVCRRLETIVKEDCIVATNTSSLSITELASVMQHPERFIGIHFFNPAPVMALTEIIPALQTNSQTVKKSFEWITAAGKKTVLAKDTPGFIVNRVARTFYTEAIRIYEEGIADMATIDWAMTTFGTFKMGPFALMDFIGHDVNYVVTETVYRGLFEEPRYRPSISQKKLVEARYLGKKSGRGFYDYNAPLPHPAEDPLIGKETFERILCMLMNDAADAVHFQIGSAQDIDTAMVNGVSYPKGLLAWADEFGIENICNKMDALYHRYHEDRYRCSVLLRDMLAQGASFYAKESNTLN